MIHLFLLKSKRRKEKNESANILSNDPRLISKWVYNWKMLFNPGLSKPAQDGLFSMKNQVLVHPIISLNSVQVERVSYQKHLGVILDEKMNFNQHIDNAISIRNNAIFYIGNAIFYL